MRINKEGYKIIGVSGVVCLLIWWVFYRLLESDASVVLLWSGTVFLLLFWFSSWRFSANPAGCAFTMPIWSLPRATGVSS